MAENVRADTFACQACTLAQALKQHLNTMDRERLTTLREKDVLLVRIPYLLKLFGILPPTVHVIEQNTQSIAPECHTALFPPFAKDDQRSLTTIKVRQAHVAQFSDADPGIPQHPENRAVTRRVAICNEPLLLRGSAGGEQGLKL